MTQFRLIAADLDGTILDDSYTVKAELLSCINKARKAGVELVVATGRLFPSALPFVRELGVKLPVIASNGAVIRDPVSGELVHQVCLDRALAVEALNLSRGHPVQRFVNVGDIFYTDSPEVNTRMYSEALKVDFVRKDPIEDIVIEDPVMVVMRGTEEDIAVLTVKLREHFGDRVYMANSKPFFIDINQPGITKGSGLAHLCQKFDFDPARIIAIGDGWNDLEMFEFAGVGAAVANAPEELKKRADYVCSETTYRGVIEVIEKFVISG